MKLRYAKALTFGVCLTLMSTGAALATGNASGGGSQGYDPGSRPYVQETSVPGQAPTEAPDAAVSYMVDSRSQLQKDIDKKLFEDYTQEISKLGIRVTHTVELEGHVEIGISPYSKENSKHISNLLKEENIKIVEGVEASIMPMMARDLPLLTEPEELGYSEDIMNIQIDLDEYMRKDNGAFFTDKGFNIYKTLPNEDYLEVGIYPYNEANADVIYELIGKDNVKVVEVPEAEMEYNQLAAEAGEDIVFTTMDANEDDSEPESSKAPLLYGLGAVTLLAGGLLVFKRK